jgi:hypothetical protein
MNSKEKSSAAGMSDKPTKGNIEKAKIPDAANPNQAKLVDLT